MNELNNELEDLLREENQSKKGKITIIDDVYKNIEKILDESIIIDNIIKDIEEYNQQIFDINSTDNEPIKKL
jgi:hypothetical protein